MSEAGGVDCGSSTHSCPATGGGHSHTGSHDGSSHHGGEAGGHIPPAHNDNGITAIYPYCDDDSKKPAPTGVAHKPGPYEQFLKRNQGVGLGIAAASTALGAYAAYDGINRIKKEEGSTGTSAQSARFEVLGGAALMCLGLYTARRL